MTSEAPERIPEDRRPPDGMIWQCATCGKRSEDRYGLVGWHSYGWDESCMLNAISVRGSAPNEP